jgi:SAM-dependent methyltransferase
MDTYKNSDISNKYKVSLPTVKRWIENALEGLNDLKLESVRGKYRVIKSVHNDSIMDKLQEQGLIYRNKSTYSKVSVSEKFYEVFSEENELEIIYNLQNRLEVPLKFTYMNGGAKIWEKIAKNGTKTGVSKAFHTTPKLLEMVLPYVESISDKRKINLIDLGPGDAVNSKAFLGHLNETGLLSSYTAVDISQEMLDIARNNVQKWYSNVNYREFVVDYENDNIGDVSRKIHQDSEINIIMLIGNSVGNVQDTIKLFKNLEFGLENNDLLVFSNRLDGYNELTSWGHLTTENERHLFIPKLLGIDTTKSKFILQYSDKRKSRTASLALDQDYIIRFKSAEVTLNKGDEILVWHHKMSTKSDLENIFELCHLEQTAYLTTPDLSHYICCCKKISNS